MAEMVDAKLHLEAICCGLALGQRHDAGVVDQPMEFGVRRSDALCERLDGLEARKIECLRGDTR
jgi:hypothetical protein